MSHNIKKTIFVGLIITTMITILIVTGIKTRKQEAKEQQKTQYVTYSNSSLGCSITHPANWAIHSSYPNDTYMDGEKVDLTKTPSVYLSSPSYKEIFRMRQEQNNPNLTFEENADFWLKYYISSTSELGNAKTEIVKVEKYEIDGKKVIQNTITYKFPDVSTTGTAVWIYIDVSDKNLLSIKYSSDSSSAQELSIYNDIVKSLRLNYANISL